MVVGGGGAGVHKCSILASHPAGPGLNTGSAEIFFSFLLSLLTEMRLNPSSAKK